MSTDEAPKAGINNDLAERDTLITEALRGISQAALGAIKDEGAPPAVAELLDHGLTLVYCGLMALNEIASAQTQLVALAERDFAKAVEEAAKSKAAVLAQEIKNSETMRNFIGRGT